MPEVDAGAGAPLPCSAYPGCGPACSWPACAEGNPTRTLCPDRCDRCGTWADVAVSRECDTCGPVPLCPGCVARHRAENAGGQP